MIIKALKLSSVNVNMFTTVSAKITICRANPTKLVTGANLSAFIV